MSITFEIQPQRSDGRGFIRCEQHRATSFALVKKETFRRKSKEYKVSRCVGRYDRLAEAELALRSQSLVHKPTARDKVRKLGRRIIAS